MSIIQYDGLPASALNTKFLQFVISILRVSNRYLSKHSNPYCLDTEELNPTKTTIVKNKRFKTTKGFLQIYKINSVSLILDITCSFLTCAIPFDVNNKTVYVIVDNNR